ncbi:MAG: hypothetical protein AUK47_13590 [Deltaproteobacteria bacterium CG2_30_63_29]|nr:MAG: hypothetical protein AUK47_13590 [Deltaproteobacteria bacterium CG2_30_63_29]
MESVLENRQTAAQEQRERERFAAAAIACREKLWGHALGLTRNSTEAEDLLQVTYVRAFERWSQLRDLSCISSWLTRMMHRAFVDQCRRRTREKLESLELLDSWIEAAEHSTQHTPSEGESEARDSVQKALGELSLVLAQALTLRDVWGFSYEEIAELLEIPVGTVRSRIARAREQMIAVLKEQGEPATDEQVLLSRRSS